jgi:glutaminyl-tRNA synthetase
VRLRYAYIIKCVDVVRDEAGEIVELRCTYDPATLSGKGPDAGRRVKGTIHWVSAAHASQAEVRLYDRLFVTEDPETASEGPDFTANLNPHSLETLRDCWVEPGLADSAPGTRYQFERVGYFCVDPDSRPERPVFNRIVGLRDTWAKIEQKLRDGD